MHHCKMEVDNQLVQSQQLGSNCRYQYKTSDYIGKGTFGIVYAASIVDRGNFTGEGTVAVKVVHLDKEREGLLTSLSDSWTSLRHRWKKLIEFKHEHLIAYHKISISQAAGGVFVEFLMDYCSGGDLNLLLNDLQKKPTSMLDRERFLDKATIVCYALQIADGLEFLHQNRFIHGDLKSRNVLIKHQSNCLRHKTLLLADLDDLVQIQQSITVSSDISNLRGSIRYMSPEMLRKFAGELSEAPGRRTDVWSLGCVIHDLVDCCFNVEEKLLFNPITAECFTLKKNTPDSQFVMKIIEGFVPYIDECIPKLFADLIRRCHVLDSRFRLTATECKNSLLEISENLTLRQDCSEGHLPACSCGRASMFVKAADIEKDYVLCVHRFYASDVRERDYESVAHLEMQLFKPRLNALSELPMATHSHGFEYVPSTILCVDGQVIFQARKISESRGNSPMAFMGYSLRERVWRQLLTDFKVHRWTTPPIVVGKNIYYWTCSKNKPCRHLRVATVADDRIQLTSSFDNFVNKNTEVWLAAAGHGNILLFLEMQQWPATETVGGVRINADTGKWEYIASMPDLRPRCHFASVVLDDHL
ncbi:uncharacterized protein LOC129592930 [Paramacrobiotus metropolitanus]|uniref:uncharacterized protein LOC129592930 n=1 Tax=Paramacrobiotus metropolitanus TaxID=2943436 RepID=UPI0024463CCF|nr:uncharacterized protein LOC129592930 [Paramacrobiotus metropolitanus]